MNLSRFGKGDLRPWEDRGLEGELERGGLKRALVAGVRQPHRHVLTTTHQLIERAKPGAQAGKELIDIATPTTPTSRK